MSFRQDIDLLKKIDAIALINEEIFSRICATTDNVTTGYQYKVTFNSSTHKFEIQPEKHTQTPSEIINLWKPQITLTPVEDIFNDHIVYECLYLQDVKNLNEHMKKVAHKFRRFGGSEEAVSDLRVFLSNFELLQVCLGSLENQLMNVTNEVDVLQGQAEKINLQVQELFNSAKLKSCDKVCVPVIEMTWKYYGNNIQLSNNNKTATSIGNGWVNHVVLGSVGLSEGMHYWEVRIDKSNNDLVGILPYFDVTNTDSIYKSQGLLIHHRSGVYGAKQFQDCFKVSNGTVVGFKLCFPQKTLTVYKDGTIWKSFPIDHLQTTLYPALELFNAGAQATIIKFEQLG